MKERPIIFSGEMVRAILDGRKTQTRRVAKGNPTIDDCPYGKIGTRLWVREAWGESKVRDQSIDDKIVLVHHAWRYKADAEVEQVQVFGRRDLKTKAELYKWKSPIFMPRWASRITLEITGVRIEQLHDISEEDAKAEGVEISQMPDVFHPYKTEFRTAWNKLHGKKAPWESNPWVWAISFKRIENDEQ